MHRCQHHDTRVEFRSELMRVGVESCEACGAWRQFEGDHEEPWHEPDERRERRCQFGERTLSGDGIDADALREVHESGWTREL
jgi:hypothetical protein